MRDQMLIYVLIMHDRTWETEEEEDFREKKNFRGEKFRWPNTHIVLYAHVDEQI